MTKLLFWLLVMAAAATGAVWLWRARRQLAERRRAEEARMASFMAQAIAKPAAPATLVQEKLLFEAAAKAGEAGEAVLSIQLYARLVSRYPQSALAPQARAAVEAHKRALGTVTAPGTAARD